MELRLGCAASPEKILAENRRRDRLPALPQHPCFSHGKPVYARQVLEEEPELGQNVLVVDLQGFYQAAGVAELLAGRGKRVRLFRPTLCGPGSRPTLTWRWYCGAPAGITMTPDVTVLVVEGSTVRGVHNYSEGKWSGASRQRGDGGAEPG